MSDWSTDRGWIYVFDGGRYLIWRSRYETARRYGYWLLAIAKQALCWHAQWKFNAAGKMDIPIAEAKKWSVNLHPRHNHAAARKNGLVDGC